jgi:antitoxin FitA
MASVGEVPPPIITAHDCALHIRRDLEPECHARIDMYSTCIQVHRMAIMIQIRNVPDALHRRLKSRAALAGMSLSDYLLGEIRQMAERPTLDELRARLQRRPETAPSVAPAKAVRAERERR